MSDQGSQSGHATAKRAAELVTTRHGFIVPTQLQRRNLAMAFAGLDRVVYGKAFDCLRIDGGEFDLSDLDTTRERIADVTLYEIKSTRKVPRADFVGYFFSLSTAELLVAQSLGAQFRFLFVNMITETVLDLSLQEVFARSKAIYPSWSIQF